MGGYSFFANPPVLFLVWGWNRVVAEGMWYSKTQTDEDAYTNIYSNLQISLETTITEIIADELEAKNVPEVEASSNHEEEEPDKSIITKKNALE